ncbi:MAG: hypothetical protein WD768_00275 [Phycisphaeraceae bacterium]
MAAKAHMSTGWKVRVGAMAFLIAGMSGWFLLDGFSGYPGKQKIHAQFMDFKAKHQGMDETKFIEAWNKHATEEGLPTLERDIKLLDKEGDYDVSDSSIMWQKILGFGTLPLAIVVISMFAGLYKKWIASEEDGIRNEKGLHIAWDQIVKLDKTRWPKKGISFLLYKQGETEGRLRIDDFWFERDPTDTIVRDIEAHLTDEQIIGDIRETERDKRKAEKKAAEEAAGAKDGKVEVVKDNEDATTPADV